LGQVHRLIIHVELGRRVEGLHTNRGAWIKRTDVRLPHFELGIHREAPPLGVQPGLWANGYALLYDTRPGIVLYDYFGPSQNVIYFGKGPVNV
jgi:hypothetical protein